MSYRLMSLPAAGGSAVLVLLCTACASNRAGVESDAARAAQDATPSLNAMTYFAHGHLLERQGNFKRAIEQYRLAIARQPAFITARNRLGITLNKAGRHAEASAVFRETIALRPGQAHLHNNLGFSLLLEGRYAEAEAECRRALAVRPDFARARMNRAIALARLGRFDESFAEFAAAGSEADAHFNVGMLRAEAGQHEQACEAMRRALELDPTLDAARTQLERFTLALQTERARLEQLAAAEERPAPDSASSPQSPADAGLARADESAVLDAPQAARADGSSDVDSGLTGSPYGIDAPAVDGEPPAANPLDGLLDLAQAFESALNRRLSPDAGAEVGPQVAWSDGSPEFPLVLTADAHLLPAPTPAAPDPWPATFAPPPAAPIVGEAEQVRLAADELLADAEYLATMLLTVQEAFDPETAFGIAADIDELVGQRLRDADLFESLYCELLERQLAERDARGDTAIAGGAPR